MTTEELRSFAAARGYRYASSRIFGTHRGYPFSATLHHSGRISGLVVLFQVTGGPDNAALKQARRELPRGSSLTRNGVRLTLSCTDGGDTLPGNFIHAMDVTTAMLRESGAVLPTTCPLCAKGDCDALGLWKDCYVPVHRACYEGRLHSTVTQVEDNTARGSYLRGWIGAVLGSIVGAIPAVLCQVLLSYFVALAFALIPLGAYYGYRMLGGRMDRMATVATVVVSLAQILGSQFMSWYAFLIWYWGELPSPVRALELYFGLMDSANILHDLLMTVIFVLLGLWIVSRQIRQTNHTAARDAGVMAESLMDYAGGRNAEL